MALSATGEVPKVTRKTSGRQRGKWAGHEDDAEELKILRRRTKDPEAAWGRIAEREVEAKAQSIISAIKKGEAIGFACNDTGHFEALSRKSENQNRAPINPKTKQPRTLYDVWARYVPTGPTTSA